MGEGARPEIDRALRFIAERLHEPLTVADVARVARLSEYHLHRVFHRAVGESVGRFITRRRLETAALRLAYERDVSITEVALSSGYSSSSNFGKAFAAYFGCSPSALRSPAGELPARTGRLAGLSGRAFQPANLYALPPTREREERREIARRWQQRVHFEEVPEQTYACLAGPGGYDPAEVEETWHGLIQRAQELGLVGEDVDAWGMAHDSPWITSPELCRYHACVPCGSTTALPAPLFRGRRLAGRYAVFHWEGPVLELGDAYREVYSCWFPESSVSPADFTPLDHYVADFPAAGRVELELWFRLRSRR